MTKTRVSVSNTQYFKKIKKMKSAKYKPNLYRFYPTIVLEL